MDNTSTESSDILIVIVIVTLLFFVAIVFAMVKLMKLAGRSQPKSPQETAIQLDYSYQRKDYIMTRAEALLFRAIEDKVGDKYYIFPQIHLNDLIDHKVHGQDWRAALSTIQRKSVDFVLVDRSTLKTVAAIELDDHTHLQSDRQQRDKVVNAIFQDAGIRLIRGKDIDTIIANLEYDSASPE